MHKHHHNSHVMFWLKSQKWTGEFLFLGSSSVWDHTSSRVSDTRASCLGAPGSMLPFTLRRSFSLPRPSPSSARQYRTAWTGETVFKRSSFGRASWCLNITHQLLVWWGDHRNSHHFANRPVPFRCAPVVWDFEGASCFMDWYLDTPGYGGGSGQLCASLGAAWDRADDLGPFGAQSLGTFRSGRGLCAQLFVGLQTMIGRANGWRLVRRSSPTCVLGGSCTGACGGIQAPSRRVTPWWEPMNHWVMADLSTQSHCRQLAAFVEIQAGGRGDAGSVCVGSAVHAWNPVLAASRWILTAVSALAAMRTESKFSTWWKRLGMALHPPPVSRSPWWRHFRSGSPHMTGIGMARWVHTLLIRPLGCP